MAVFASAHRAPPDLNSISDIYIDESSQTKHRYLILGGIVAEKRQIASIDAEIARLRLPELPHGEMKWNKVSGPKLFCYKRLVDAFFDRPQFLGAHFHSLVVDTQNVDHKAFNDGSREVGFNKEIYQLASKFARLYPKRPFHLYPDERETNQRPEDLRTILNFGRRKAGDPRDWPFRRCHFRDSKATPLLQLVDILIGAIGYHVNGHIEAADASPHKVRLARYVLRRAGVSHPERDTAVSGKFTIWHRQLRPKKGRPPTLG